MKPAACCAQIRDRWLLLDLHLPDGSASLPARPRKQAAPPASRPRAHREGEDRILREARRLGAALVTKRSARRKLSQRIAMMFGDAEPEAREHVGRDTRGWIGNAVLAAVDPGAA